MSKRIIRWNLELASEWRPMALENFVYNLLGEDFRKGLDKGSKVMEVRATNSLYQFVFLTWWK
jgi:hypothetical protein